MMNWFGKSVIAMSMLAMCGTASAQQPTTVNPTASSVKEQQLLDALKGAPNGAVAGRVSIHDGRSANLIRPANQGFRATHEGIMPKIGAVAILGMLAALALFYFRRGRIQVSKGLSGHTIERFGSFARFNHWMTATSFILLALSGLNLTFGKAILLPIIGEGAFAGLSAFGKMIHNYVSLAFALGVAVMLIIWAKDNIPNGRDVTWLKEGGGMVGDKHPPAGKFNGGQKLLFWVVVVGGAALTFTGYSLMFASGDVGSLQTMNVVHGLIGALMVAVIMGHIYIGTLGMQGAFSAMGSGQVDVNWAREHHSVWAEDVTGHAAQKPQAAE